MECQNKTIKPSGACNQITQGARLSWDSLECTYITYQFQQSKYRNQISVDWEKNGFHRIKYLWKNIMSVQVFPNIRPFDIPWNCL